MKNRIEEIRKEKGILQEEFAKAMGVSRQTISSLERGRYNPSILLAYHIAKYFDMTIEEVFLFEEDPEDGSALPSIPKASKLLLYGLSTGAAYLVMRCLNSLLGDASLGFPSFDYAEPAAADFAMMLIYIPAGMALFMVFGYSEKLTGRAAGKMPAVLSETVCGAVAGRTVI